MYNIAAQLKHSFMKAAGLQAVAAAHCTFEIPKLCEYECVCTNSIGVTRALAA